MSLREQMPEVTAFIDAMREAFGADGINRQIALSLRGEPTFFARENGHQVGTTIPGGAVTFQQFGPDRWERTEAAKDGAIDRYRKTRTRR